ncbi:MAG: hypothetical protein V1888_01195 [archaeon]
MAKRKLIGFEKMSCNGLVRLCGIQEDASSKAEEILVKAYDDGETMPFGCNYILDNRDVSEKNLPAGIFCDKQGRYEYGGVNNTSCRCKFYTKE